MERGAAGCNAVARTASGPSSETIVAASGSVVLRHWQSGLGFAGWCIGHCAFPVCTQVQPIASAECALEANSDTGADVSNVS